MNSTEKSTPVRNPVREVSLLIVAVVIGLVGVYLRFADFAYSSQIADVIFLIAVIFAIRVVLVMMK
jgi:hypothetical protein